MEKPDIESSFPEATSKEKNIPHSITDTIPKCTNSLNLRLFSKLVFVVLFMFGFGFSLVPIYKSICSVTGLNNLTKKGSITEEAKKNPVNSDRTVLVEFDSNVQQESGLMLTPEIQTKKVHPGQLVTVFYNLSNKTNYPIVGQAIPSYLPQKSSKYFQKLECFCFRQQKILPMETKRLAVVFFLGSDIPDSITSVTLSYTFLKIPNASVAE